MLPTSVTERRLTGVTLSRGFDPPSRLGIEIETSTKPSSPENQRTLTPQRLKIDGLVFLFSVIVLLICAVPIDSKEVGGLEVAIFEAINGLPDALYPVVWVFMQLGNIVAVPVAAVVAAGFRRFKLATGILFSGLFVWVLAKIVKDLIPRGRPGELLENVILHGDTPMTGRGFVSGHAAVVAAIATVATPYLGTRGRWIVWTLVAITATARVYVGAHLPLDSIGGVALGIAGGTLALVILDLIPGKLTGRPSLDERPSETTVLADRQDDPSIS